MLHHVYSCVPHSPTAGFGVDRSRADTVALHRALESGLDAHSTNPVLKLTYQPALLARAPHLSADIAYLLGTSDWQSHPISLELQAATPAPLRDYVSRIRSLAASNASARLLLAHAYVRYLGDLSGGQVIKRCLTKEYNLPETGEGVRFYEFESASGDGSKADQLEMRQVKDWYRGGMDAGVGDDEKLKGEFIVPTPPGA
jgi:heme oxygenase (biliverdin-producing, ferredoxin)